MRLVWFLPLLLISVALSACPTEKCTPANCSGCCAVDGLCVSGNARTECGSKGGECVACLRTERCVDQQCLADDVPDGSVDAGPVVCSCATTCCFADGSCAPNNDPTACGAPRQFCGACQAGARCELGACVTTTCTSGCFDGLGVCRAGNEVSACGSDGGVCSACGADQACTNRRCVFTRCDVDNCRFGCCRPDLSCELSPSAMACGLSGSACVACAAMESCIGGQCL